MKSVRIVAKWDEDEAQSLVLVAAQDENGWIADNVEMFGYVKDQDDDHKYVRYPFVAEKISERDAVLDWGALDNTTATANLYGRRLVAGEKIQRIENREIYEYTIVSIVPFGS